MIAQTVITKAHLDKAMSYEEYTRLTEQLLSENKTTGTDHSEKMLGYTRLNMQRMKKWDKIAEVDEALRDKILAIDKTQYWVVLVEAWCGDVAQNLPIIQKIAALNPSIELRLLLRDENPEVMDQYLTNGGKAIPKMVILDGETLEELNTWGPRPMPVQEMLQEFKSGQITYEAFAEKAHAWYAKDRTHTVQKEFLALLS